MEKLRLNETPVRTSKNFNINDIKLENVKIPSEIPQFQNVKISYDDSKVNVKDEASNVNLVYGIDKSFTQQIKSSANQNIKLEINSDTETKIEAEFFLDKENAVLLENIEIIASPNTKATVIVKYKADDNIEGFHNGIINLVANENAKINVIVVNLTNIQTNNFVNIQNQIEEKAEVKYTIVDFGGNTSITNYYSNLIGDESSNSLDTICLGREEQIIDLNYIAELRGKKTNIDIEVQGALKDKSKKHFKGTIDFKKGCKKAKGNEHDSCMLLSDTARSISLPMLLCSEEEVEGNHSSAAGKIGPKELFYIMSRGMEQKEAMKLMVRAKFNKTLEKINDENLKNEIISEIDKKLD